MKEIYHIGKAYPYQEKPEEVMIALDDSFEFSEFIPGRYGVPGYRSYLCVIQGASKYKEIISDLENSETIVDIYHLPEDTVILVAKNIRFLGVLQKPKLIPMEDLNKKLAGIKENIIWVDLSIPDLKITGAYKFIEITGDEEVTICTISNQGHLKSIAYLPGEDITTITEDVCSFSFSDNKFTTILSGELGEKLWKSLISGCLSGMNYSSSEFLEEFDFDFYRKRFNSLKDKIYKEILNK